MTDLLKSATGVSFGVTNAPSFAFWSQTIACRSYNITGKLRVTFLGSPSP
jgi:hypothetical protein